MSDPSRDQVGDIVVNKIKTDEGQAWVRVQQKVKIISSTTFFVTNLLMTMTLNLKIGLHSLV